MRLLSAVFLCLCFFFSRVGSTKAAYPKNFKRGELLKKLTTILLMLSALFLLFSAIEMQKEYKELANVQKSLESTKTNLENDVNELKLLQTEINEYLKQIDLIHSYSLEYNVPVEIILAIMKLESGYDVNAISPNGKNIGIMQINEVHFNNKMEILKLNRNVECGVSLLSGLKQRNEDLHYILNSYNMGRFGYEDYVKKTGKTTRHYSREGIKIIKQLKK